ncbi:hypothetical protein F383_35366 [Gossypium arboreum]|uniref:Uncharacterized protein n=1 Tax=Gossypium arboreum TaxID=29729 RepID=A0A0B0PVF5_GOSAR|nr:hypothetical protein F383_35366 [Gossypium arboreum]
MYRLICILFKFGYV